MIYAKKFFSELYSRKEELIVNPTPRFACPFPEMGGE